MASLLTLLQGVTAVSAYAINILSSTALGAEGRGFLVLTLQLTYFAAVLIVMGIERPFMAIIQLPFAPALRAFVYLVRPGMILGILGACIGVALTILGYFTVGVAILLGSFYALLNGLGKGVRVASISSGSGRPLIIFTTGTQVGMVLLGLALSALNVDSPLVWLGAYTATGLTSVVILVVAFRNCSGANTDQRTNQLIRSQGVRLLPASIGNTAMVRSDRLIIPAFLGTAALGVYSAVSTVMEMASWPIAQWVDASLGKWKAAGRAHRGKELVQLSLGAVLAAALIAGLVGVIAYASIVLLLPDEFRSSTSLIVPLGVSSVIYALGRVQQGVLVIRGQAGTVSVVELLGTGAAVMGYLTMIPMFGVAGAAYGAIVGYSVTALTGAYALYRPRRQK